MSAPLFYSLIEALRASCSKRQFTSIYVGFSGGADSRLLLELACKVFGAENVTALHVDHGMSSNSNAWAKACKETTKLLGCSIQIESVNVTNHGSGLEAEARDQRYRFFDQAVEDNSVLFLGQHLDDQVETFFLRLLRGTGLKGLTGMEAWSQRKHYTVARPLLSVSKSQIIELAQELGLTWVEDESNHSSVQDRNFLRNDILPMLEARWPSYRDRVQHMQHLISEAEQPQSEKLSDALSSRLSHDGGLKMVELESWTRSDKLSLLHLWLKTLNVQIPSKTRLEQILDTVAGSRADANPSVDISSGSVRRHGPALYWVASPESVGTAPDVLIEQTADWPGIGQVGLKATEDRIGLNGNLPDLSWRLREGTEYIRPFGRSKQRDLKRVMQEYRIKPWFRDRTPLLFSGDTLIAVGDEIVSADHVATDHQPKLRVVWHQD